MPREFISDNRVRAFVVSKTGLVLSQSYTQLGILQRDEVTAGFIFTHFSGHDISVSMAASPGSLTKIFLTRLGHYAYGELGCARVSVLTEQPRVIKLALRLGAQIEGFKRDAFGPGRGATLLGILAADWKFR